jgi:hypothetical protein
MQWLRTIRWLPVAGLLACGLTASDTVAGPGQLAVGTWGSNDNGVLVTKDQVHVHVGCTKGDFPFPSSIDANGAFEVPGQYALRAYPIFREYLPARMTGVVRGSELTFTIAVNDTVTQELRTVGPRTVRLGVEPRMAICPICRTEDLKGPPPGT